MPMMLIVIAVYFLVRRWNGDVVQLVAVAGVLGVGYFAYSAYRSRQEHQRAEKIEEADITALEAKVESMFADAANRILKVEGHHGLTVTPDAGEHFEKAVTIFVSVDGRLSAAVSSAQLRSLSAELDEALWQLTAAQALLDGEEPPTRSRTREPIVSPTDSATLSGASRDAVARWVDGSSSVRRRRRRSC
jgi:hypothetical protein